MKNWEVIINENDEITDKSLLGVKVWALRNGVMPCEFEANKDIPVMESKIYKLCDRFRDCKDCLETYLKLNEIMMNKS